MIYSNTTKVRILDKYNGVIVDVKVVHRKKINSNIVKYKILVDRGDQLPYFFWLTEEYFIVHRETFLVKSFFKDVIKKFFKSILLLKIVVRVKTIKEESYD